MTPLAASQSQKLSKARQQRNLGIFKVYLFTICQNVSNSHFIQPYLPFREGYYVFDGVIMYRDRVVVPVLRRGTVLKALHAAHQGVSAMERCTRATFFGLYDSEY